MTQTTFTDNVLVQGSRDIQQLEVKGHSTQTTPLQNWRDNASNLKAQVTGDGRFQIGNNLSGGAPADALIQANNDVSPSGLTSGLHTLGRITGTIAGAINWVVHELQLLGTGGVTGIHIASRTKLTQSNTGSSTAAELRASDSQAINQTGSSGARVGQITGLRGTANNATSAYLNKAVGIEASIVNDAGGNVTQAAALSVVPTDNKGPIASLLGLQVNTPINSGAGAITNLYGVKVEDQAQGTNNYAIYTGAGLNRLGDQVQVLGSADRVQALIKAASVQNNDLQQWQNNVGGVLSVVNKNGWIGAGRASATSALHAASLSFNVVYKTAAYTLQDNDVICLVTAATALTITLPTAVGHGGRTYMVKRVFGGVNVTLATTGGQTIDGAATQVLTANNQVIRVVSDDLNWYII
jgi:hypothetical protein